MKNLKLSPSIVPLTFLNLQMDSFPQCGNSPGLGKFVDFIVATCRMQELFRNQIIEGYFFSCLAGHAVKEIPPSPEKKYFHFAELVGENVKHVGKIRKKYIYILRNNNYFLFGECC